MKRSTIRLLNCFKPAAVTLPSGTAQMIQTSKGKSIYAPGQIGYDANDIAELNDTTIIQPEPKNPVPSKSSCCCLLKSKDPQVGVNFLGQ